MEWVRYKTGEPLLYAGRLSEMSAEEYRRFRHCFEVERKQQEKEDFGGDAISRLHEQLRREFMA